uniref:DDE Tnp4 domain-containing protein n=1 Tax=Ditylenchus dipsaci TaxID=166011 RepID=A0A915DD56_9BILA
MPAIGSQGHNNDAGIFNTSDFRKERNADRLNLPPASRLSASDRTCPYYWIGDGIFPLFPNLMKPIPGHELSREERYYNYRISRARSVVENYFEILAMKFRVFLKPIETTVDTAIRILKAAVVLLNFLLAEMPWAGNPRAAAD